MKISLNLDNTSDSLDIIKYCTLYFDHVIIDPQIIDTGIQFDIDPSGNGFRCTKHFISYCSEEIQKISHILIEEEIFPDEPPSEVDIKQNNNSKIQQTAQSLVAKNANLLFTPNSYEFKLHKEKTIFVLKPNAEVISDEAKLAYKKSFTQTDREKLIEILQNKGITKPDDALLTFLLYVVLVKTQLKHIENNENTLANSSIINKILLNYYSSLNKKTNDCGLKFNFAKVEAAKILLPFVRNAPIEDILEIRHKANDELLELRNYIDTTLHDLSYEEINHLPYDDIARQLKQKLTPSIKQFERKLTDLNIFTAREFIKNMANPLYYSPLLTTFLTNIPPSTSLGLSIGMISAYTYLQRKSKHLEIQNDPLYFTIKLPKTI